MSEPLYKRVLRGGASAAVGHEWELAQRIAELEAENAELQRAYEQERLDFREMKRRRERAEAAERKLARLVEGLEAHLKRCAIFRQQPMARDLRELIATATGEGK